MQLVHGGPNFTDCTLKTHLDAVATGFPSHIIKTNDDRLLLKIKDVTKNVPITLLTHRVMDKQWERKVKSLPPLETLLVCSTAMTTDMMAFTIAANAESHTDLARLVQDHCARAPLIGAQLFRKGNCINPQIFCAVAVKLN